MCTHEKGTCVRCATEEQVEAEARLGERLDSHTAKFMLRNLSNGVPATVDRFIKSPAVVLEPLLPTASLANGQASLPNEAQPLSSFVSAAREQKHISDRTVRADEWWDKVQTERGVGVA